jgi:MFS family permease
MTASASASYERAHSEMTRENAVLFWGCFIALITTAFGFIARMFLIGTWASEFGLDAAQSGRLAGIGIWPFAVSIIGFSLIIDKIGYKIAMLIAFVGHITWAAMGVSAYFLSQKGDKQTAFQLLYWGSLILALGNGTVEAFINPVVATMFNREKTKWLNILHAGWPGGLVIAGVIAIFIDTVPWFIKVGIIAVPAIIYLVMLLPCKFPVQEREAAGVSYRDMLAEFGILGALVVGVLLFLQLSDFFTDGSARPLSNEQRMIFGGISAAFVVLFGLYTQALGRILMFFLILIMMPLATTEIGTDGWITAIMESVSAGKFHPGWILVFTSIIMMILRFFAGPIIHTLSPLGLLALSAALAVAGLYMLSTAVGTSIFIAATLYGIGKTFFWPTMLGVVSEQMPKGGALTLNAISGIGMLAVGTVGFPFIGTLQASREIQAVASHAELSKEVPGLVADGKLTVTTPKTIYEVISYNVIDQEKVDALLAKLPEAPKDAEGTAKTDVVGTREHAAALITEVRSGSKQGALADMAFFPAGMLVGYLILIVYFMSKGGYKPVHMVTNEEAAALRGNGDDKFGTIKTESGRNISDKIRSIDDRVK